jgi:rhomboid protease GluP
MADTSSATPSVGDSGPVHFALRPPPFWSPSFTVVFLLAVAVGAAYGVGLRAQATSFSLLEYLVPLLMCAAVLAGRILTRPRAIPPISFFDDHISAPKSAESKRATNVGYDDIMSIDLRGRGPTERLFIGTRRVLLVYPRPAFADAEAIERMLKELYVRLSRLPNGPRIIEEISRRRKLALAALTNSPAATHGILGAMAMIFGMQYLGGAFNSTLGVVRFGALTAALVKEGEIHRLLSAAAVHVDLLHLYFEGLSLFFLGSILERLLGQARFSLIFFVSALASALAFVLAPPDLVFAGASGAIFGLFGSFVVVSLRFHSELPVGFRQRRAFWVFVSSLAVILPLLVHRLHPHVHLVGLLAGALTTLLVVDIGKPLDPSAPTPASLRFPAAALSVLFALCTLGSVFWAVRHDRYAELDLARTIVDHPEATPTELNGVAWGYAIDKRSSPDELTLARLAAERALSMTPNELAIIDTLAGVYYRQGAIERALPLQVRVINEEDEPLYKASYAAHLAQMLDAQLDAGVVSAEAQAVTVRVDPTAVPPLQVSAPVSPDGTTIFVVARQGEPAVGLLRIQLGAGRAGAALAPRSEVRWPEAAAYDVALIVPGCGGCAEQSARLDVWSVDGSLRDLP